MTASLAAFRARVRTALAEPAVAGPLAALRAATEREPDERDLYRALGKHGLLAVDWPVEYGGLGLTASHAAIAVEEMFQAGVPDTLQVNSIQIVGRFLLLAGTEDQRKRYLPGLARAELYAGVLYTEPGAGSDLAALRTTAVATRDGFVLNGVKVFSLKGHRTDIALCAARTGEADERYEGITLFLIDMRAPGVRRTDIPSIAAERFHRVELNDVAVGADQVIGQVGGGWPLLGTALAVERTGLDYALRAQRWHAAATERITADPEPAAVERLTRFGVRTDAGLALANAMIRRLDAGDVDETAFAASKYYASELAADIATWAAMFPGAATPSSRILDAAYLEAPGLTISAGTSEVMLRIVASTVLEDRYAPESPETDDTARRLRAGLRDLLAEVPAPGDPHAPPADHGRNAPAWAALHAVDATVVEAPASAGGLHLGTPAGLVLMEELGRAGLGCPYAATALTVHAITASPESAAAHGTTLTGLMSGERSVALAGFDGPPVALLGTGPDRRVTGTVTAASDDVELVAVPARTDDATGLALLPVDRADRRADGEALLRFTDAPVAEFITPVGDAVLAAARLRQAAYLTGLALGAHAEAARYVNQRHQFGAPLRDQPTVSFTLARGWVELLATRQVAWAAAERDTVTAGYAAGVLALAAETAVGVLRDAMHLCGVRALTGHTLVQRYYRMVRAEAVRFGGTATLWREAGRDTPSSRGRTE